MFELQPPADDGLYIAEVGDWSENKHHFLRRYIDAFTTSMRLNPAWPGGIHYIDLFAGPGIVRLRASQRLEWGSPLIAAQAPHSFDGLYCCERNRKAHAALKSRLDRIGTDSSVHVVRGDANKKVGEIVGKIPSGSLSLAFLDPFGLDLDYATVEVLARKRIDLIIFFPDHLDALRNWEKVYQLKPDSKMDRYMGPGVDWLNALRGASLSTRAEVLRKLYTGQIGKLGYTEFEYERVASKGHPLYLLIFCSRHEFAARLWRRVSQKKPDDQQSFDFGAPG